MTPPSAARAELDALESEITTCRRCPRLVAWREEVARVKRASFADQEYWGRPVPGFGDPEASIVVLGLAPAAHGGNRTGRVFTGDRSGDWLFAALWRAGLANQPESRSRDDGLALTGCWVSAAVRCAPPDNRPTPEERDTCLPYFGRERALLTRARVVVCLGGFAWDAALRSLGAAVARPKPRFGQGTEVAVGELTLLGCYHVSQQNTFTGRLTEPMLDAVFARALSLAGLPSAGLPSAGLPVPVARPSDRVKTHPAIVEDTTSYSSPEVNHARSPVQLLRRSRGPRGR